MTRKRNARGYRAVLFDVEGVIAHADPGILAARLGRLGPGLDAEALVAARNGPDLYPLWTTYSVGALPTADYWAAVAGALGLPATPEMAAAVGGAYRAAAWAWLDATVLALAAELRSRGGLKVGLLSNSAPEHEAHIPAFEAAFDLAHFSHRTGRRKPDAAAYLAAAKELGLAPAEVLFVDDKPRNVAAAEALGMAARVFSGAAELAAEFITLGLLPAREGREGLVSAPGLGAEGQVFPLDRGESAP